MCVAACATRRRRASYAERRSSPPNRLREHAATPAGKGCFGNAAPCAELGRARSAPNSQGRHLPSSENPLSRGYGKLQWRLLTILAEHERSPASRAGRIGRGLDTPTLARRVHGREPTRSELVSVRRAPAALMRNGEVRIFMCYGHRHYWIREQARRERSG